MNAFLMTVVLACGADIQTGYDKATKVPEVDVTVDQYAWYGRYKGKATTWPRDTAWAEVKALAGAWGREIDATAVPTPPATISLPGGGIVVAGPGAAFPGGLFAPVPMMMPSSASTCANGNCSQQQSAVQWRRR